MDTFSYCCNLLNGYIFISLYRYVIIKHFFIHRLCIVSAVCVCMFVYICMCVCEQKYICLGVFLTRNLEWIIIIFELCRIYFWDGTFYTFEDYCWISLQSVILCFHPQCARLRSDLFFDEEFEDLKVIRMNLSKALRGKHILSASI